LFYPSHRNRQNFIQLDKQLLRRVCYVSSYLLGDSIAASVGDVFIAEKAFADA